jgi:predicted O-linked N-acetylglucosamine transferase (SPINDLY family)
LATIRKGLRVNMARSPLCDKKAYARCVEQAYREMWEKWRESIDD